MATANKTGRAIVAATTSTTQTTGSLDITTALGLLIMLRVTNGATGPSTGCLMTINVSTDGSTWRKFRELRANTGNSVETITPVSIPSPAMHVQVVFGTTDQGVTKEAIGHELTSIG